MTTRITDDDLANAAVHDTARPGDITRMATELRSTRRTLAAIAAVLGDWDYAGIAADMPVGVDVDCLHKAHRAWLLATGKEQP